MLIELPRMNEQNRETIREEVVLNFNCITNPIF